MTLSAETAPAMMKAKRPVSPAAYLESQPARALVMPSAPTRLARHRGLVSHGRTA